MTELKQAPVPNKEQQRAIDTYKENGTYLVLAGPGTGKTFTVSRRIKASIEAGTPPERILCLTFSETAASEMKKGIERAFALPSLNVNVNTYHGFCYEIIKNNPDIFAVGDNVKIITDSISKAFMKECIDEKLVKHKNDKEIKSAFVTDKNGPYYFIDTILEQIKEIKKYKLDKEQYFKNLQQNPDWIPNIIKKEEYCAKRRLKDPNFPDTGALKDARKKVAKAEELWELYELYSNKMKRKNFIDFGDMIMLVLKEFETNPDFAVKIASEFDYIIADEYQDTNMSQNEILFTLAKNMKNQNVFVVGDDDQIIYTFQGARLDSVKNFIKELDVKKDNVICFKENRRSTPKVLEAARQIVLLDDISLEKDASFKDYNISKELISANKALAAKNKDVRYLIYRDALQERVHITDEIKNLVNSDECPRDSKTGEKKLSEIAVLTRTNEELIEYANLLRAANIPFETKNGKNIFEIQSVAMMILYMQFLCNSTLYADSFFKLIVSKPFNINEKDYGLLYRTRNYTETFIENMKRLEKNGAELCDKEKFANFIKTYDELKELKQSTNLKDAILTIGNKTGIFTYYINCRVNRSENIAGLKKLVDDAESFSMLETPCTLEFFVSYLEKAMQEGIKIFADKPPVKQNAVQLVTYHGSKGSEYEYVWMPYLVKKQINFESPSIPLSIQDDISKNDITGEDLSKDEKDAIKKSNLVKLIYVAMTRAKHTLNLSRVKLRVDGKDAEPWGLFTSPGINTVINPIEYGNEENDEAEYEEEVIKSLSVCDRDYKKEFNDYLKAVLSGKTYSASSVNTYLNCSREYLYTQLLGFCPQTENADKAHFGTAVHAAYEFAVNKAIETGSFPKKHEFAAKFEDVLKSLPVSSPLELKRMLNDGEKVLLNAAEDGLCCYDYLAKTPVNQLYCAEHAFEFKIDDETFKGKIDRIDKLPGGKYVIYDYKTGDRRGENEICLEGAHEDYYNQMALYKHFLREELNCGYDDISTVFIFPREYRSPFVLELSQEDCIAVVEKFAAAIKSIKSLIFEPVQKKGDSCMYCPYKNSYCKLNII